MEMEEQKRYLEMFFQIHYSVLLMLIRFEGELLRSFPSPSSKIEEIKEDYLNVINRVMRDVEREVGNEKYANILIEGLEELKGYVRGISDGFKGSSGCKFLSAEEALEMIEWYLDPELGKKLQAVWKEAIRYWQELALEVMRREGLGEFEFIYEPTGERIKYVRCRIGNEENLRIDCV